MLDEVWLSLVRMARDIGDISSIFPPGIQRLTDLPFTHHNAILAALGFLSFDELRKEERPPKSIWLDSEKMELHWEQVKNNREARANGEKDSTMTQNPLMKRLKIIET